MRSSTSSPLTSRRRPPTSATPLPGRIRQTNSGHTHAQNAAGDIQHGNSIDLVEGSTGAGGLDNIVRGAARPPIEFSIESVAANCEFTRAIRFQIRTPQTPASDQPAAYGDNVTATTVYFTPQKLQADRDCSGCPRHQRCTTAVTIETAGLTIQTPGSAAETESRQMRLRRALAHRLDADQQVAQPGAKLADAGVAGELGAETGLIARPRQLIRVP